MDAPVNQRVEIPGLDSFEVGLYLKRDDLLHPIISGNKFRKLKYNLQRAKKEKYTKLLTFGGAYSNHILAVACAGHEHGFETIGIIRGEELQNQWKDNPTLKRAFAYGMQLDFVSREEYREKNTKRFVEVLQTKYEKPMILPEGGTNALAVKGCMEILTEEDASFDHVCCAVGTGGTISGVINASEQHQTVLGFPALKGDFLKADIATFVKRDNWNLISDYHFGGYGKVDEVLVNFINTFKKETGIPLDPVYTGKMMFGIVDLIQKGHFPKGSKILAIHTGGLQGITGMNQRLKQRKMPVLEI
ncbi:MAG: pyridoxal-phosphate dependent enzyme [Bacteroidota bacterium]